MRGIREVDGKGTGGKGIRWRGEGMKSDKERRERHCKNEEAVEEI